MRAQRLDVARFGKGKAWGQLFGGRQCFTGLSAVALTRVELALHVVCLCAVRVSNQHLPNHGLRLLRFAGLGCGIDLVHAWHCLRHGKPEAQK